MEPLRMTGTRKMFFLWSTRVRSMWVMCTCLGSSRSKKREREVGALVKGAGISEADDLKKVFLVRLVGIVVVGSEDRRAVAMCLELETFLPRRNEVRAYRYGMGWATSGPSFHVL